MDFDLSTPQTLLKDTARQVLARECKPARVRQLMETDTAYDDALWRAIADQGWTGLIVPEEFGGLGTGVVEVAAVCEEMGRACLPGPFLSTLFAAALIRAAGTREQQKNYLEPIAAGEMKATVAILDESANWNLNALGTSTKKMFVTDAAVADVILCVTKDGIFAVDRSAATVKAMRGIDDTRKICEVSFGSLDAGRKLQGGIEAVRAAIDLATIALCAEMVGGMQWILETTVEYAKTRQQFGKPIGAFQAVQHQCADMLLMTESSRSATYYAAWALTENDPGAAVAVSVAKAYCSDACREVGNRGVQVHGGIGFTWEHDLQLYYKRAKSSETLFGDAAFHRERIASYVVDGSPRTAARLDRETAAVAAT